MVVFDATTLLLLLSPDVAAPPNSATGQPVERVRDRIDYLVQRLEKDRAKIIVPTPALSEILVRTGTAGPEYLSRIKSAAVFRIVPFDERAAVEVAAMTQDALRTGDKRHGGEGTWAKLKYDRQIVAIAKVEGVSVIYSDDGNIHNFGGRAGLSVIRIADLPLPPDDTQQSLPLEERGIDETDNEESGQDE